MNSVGLLFLIKWAIREFCDNAYILIKRQHSSSECDWSLQELRGIWVSPYFHYVNSDKINLYCKLFVKSIFPVWQREGRKKRIDRTLKIEEKLGLCKMQRGSGANHRATETSCPCGTL